MTPWSPPGSSVHGVLQTRTLQWVAMPSSRGSSQPRSQTHISYVSCIADGFSTTSITTVKVKSLSPTTAYQAPPSMGFSRQEYWSGVPLPSPITGAKRAICPFLQMLPDCPSDPWQGMCLRPWSGPEAWIGLPSVHSYPKHFVRQE